MEMLEAIEREEARRAGAADPVAFAISLGVTPDTWQRDVLRSTNKRILLNCCRQAGKSTTFALRALHRAIYTPKALVLIVAPSWRQSAEVLRKVQDFMGALPVPAHLETDSKTEVSFKNGSRIVSLPAGEAKIRGFSAVTELILDESGDVPDELYHAVLPMLIISRGTLLAGGTPKGRRGFFFDAWDKGGDGWDRIEAPWTACPRMDAAEIAVQRAGLKEIFAQEFECQFVRLTGGMVYASFTDETCGIDALPSSAEWRYMLSIDFGFVDATAFVVLGWLPNDPVLYAVLSFKETGYHADDIAARIKTLRTTYPFTKIIGDIGGYGKGPAEELLSRFSVFIEPAPKTDKAGYIDILNGAFAQGRVKLFRPTNAGLIDELVALPWNATRTNHADGYQDHLCFVAGTQVETEHGPRAIESIRPGDMVWTRQGLRPVTEAAQTQESGTYELHTAQGRVLRGTGDHPIMVDGGQTALALLTPGTMVTGWENTESAKSSSSTDDGFGDIPTLPSARFASTGQRNAGSDSTARYGKRLTDRSRRGTTCTTSTRTRSTTPSTTWLSSRRAITCVSTCARLSVKPWRGGTFAKPSLPPLLGTPLPRGSRGTWLTAATVGSIARSSRSSAWCAAPTSKQKSLTQRSAATPALRSSAATPASTTSTGHAPSAVAHTARTDTRSVSAARDRVLRVVRTGLVERVYNLSVSDVHEYFANGILVSNCDGLLYGFRASSAHLQEALPPPLAPTEIIQQQTAAVWREHEESMRRNAQRDFDVGEKMFGEEDWA